MKVALFVVEKACKVEKPKRNFPENKSGKGGGPRSVNVAGDGHSDPEANKKLRHLAGLNPTNLFRSNANFLYSGRDGLLEEGLANQATNKWKSDNIIEVVGRPAPGGMEEKKANDSACAMRKKNLPVKRGWEVG